MELENGKLPPEILSRWLATRGSRTGDGILIGPSPGEDTAVIDFPSSDPDGELLVVTSDPITFASIEIGEYAITVNENDIATSGGQARWLFATVLLPSGVPEAEAEDILRGISSACSRHGVSLAGGHTEITSAVNRPIVSATLLGTVARSRLLDKRAIEPGNRILITKGAAVEGTSILAAEGSRRLEAAGVDADVIGKAKRMIEKISVVSDARTAIEAGGVVAMHDVTEGGVATALTELGAFARLEVALDAIPVLPCCREICRVFGIDPLGLIGSGSLLIASERSHSPGIIEALTAKGIECTDIGEVISGAPGVEWTIDGKTAKGPEFSVDEITKINFRAMPSTS